MSVRAVFFDFDGVIADTENVHIAAWERAFAMMGWDVPPEVVERSSEVDDHEFLADVFGRKGVEGDVDGWVARKREIALEMLADWPRGCPGVVELVGRLKGRARLVVVTSGWRANVERVLDGMGIRGAFARIVAKEDVRAIKPDPELYRVALKALKLKPDDAIALEDAASGLRAARAAGLRCIAVGRRSLPADLCGELLARVPDCNDADAILRLLGLDGSKSPGEPSGA